MADVVNNVISNILLNVKGLDSLASLEAKLASFKTTIKSMSAIEVFDMRDDVLKNYDNLATTLSPLQDRLSNLKDEYDRLTKDREFKLPKQLAELKNEQDRLNTENNFNKKYQEVADEISRLEPKVRSINSSFAKTSSILGTLTAETAKFGGTRTNFDFLSQAVNETGYDFALLNNFMSQNNWVATKNGKIFQRNTGTYISAGKAIDTMRKKLWRFNMNMLTIMFAMMALQRMITQFGRSAITTYQKANEDTVGLGKSTWHLIAAWEFFKYSLVDALTQSDLFKTIVQWLLQIVMWFNKLKPATKSVIAIGLAIAGLVASAGVLYSVFKPFIEIMLLSLPKLTSLVSGSGGLSGAFASLGASIWPIAIIMGIIIALWMSDLGNFRDFVKNTLDVVFTTFTTIFNDIYNIVKTVIDLVVAIFKGDWDKVLELSIKLLAQLASLFIKAWMGIMAALVNYTLFGINLIIDIVFKILIGGFIWGLKKLEELWIRFTQFLPTTFQQAINWIIDKLISLVNIWNSIFGKKLGFTFDTSVLEDFKKPIDNVAEMNKKLAESAKKWESLGGEVKQFADNIKIDYISGDMLKEGFGAVNDLFGLNSSKAAPLPNTVDELGQGVSRAPVQNVSNNNNQFENIFNIQGPPEETYKFFEERMSDVMSRMSGSVIQ